MSAILWMWGANACILPHVLRESCPDSAIRAVGKELHAPGRRYPYCRGHPTRQTRRASDARILQSDHALRRSEDHMTKPPEIQEALDPNSPFTDVLYRRRAVRDVVESH